MGAVAASPGKIAHSGLQAEMQVIFGGETICFSLCDLCSRISEEIREFSHQAIAATIKFAAAVSVTGCKTSKQASSPQ